MSIIKLLKTKEGYKQGIFKTIIEYQYDSQGNIIATNEIPNPELPQDLDSLKQAIKDTLDYYTQVEYINKKLKEIQEDLTDIATEQSYLEGVFYSLGLDPNQVKAEVTKVVLGQEDLATAQSNLGLADEYLPYLQRAIEIASIINWKESIWKAEAELEAKVDSYTDYDILLDDFSDIPKLCDDTYSQFTIIQY